MTQKYLAGPPENRPENVVVVRDAGLVIAAPYLARLLPMLGLVVEHSFVDRAATQHAVRLMDYLVFDADAPTESTSSLGRVLCGLPLTEAISDTSSLSERERQAIDTLLASMMTQWKAIGNISIEGLRSTFLAREGHLVKEERGWHLSVEPATFDMLLDRLPWSFTNCRFPWMPEPLVVSWR